ncbi:MAG: hypothetical protein NZ902_01080 [Acidilobaceae archaeon]|nr:hypothetical protein [Acidilobaceae archaeon]MDW7973847.1 hypothetical protein [Sulfolobales archaeon]
MTLFEYAILALISLLAVAMVIWYFRVRKEMLLLTRTVVVELEKHFKPREKSYVLLGYLVGFKGKYELNNGDQVFILFTTMPRMSLLYYPIAKMLGRKDRLEVALKYSNRYVLRDFHLVNVSDSWATSTFLRDVGERREKMQRRELRANYVAFLEDLEDEGLAKKLLDMSKAEIHRVSAFREHNLVEVAVEARLGAVGEILKILEEMRKRVTRSRHSEEA